MKHAASPPVELLSDPELVARYVRQRDEIAFAALVRRHSSLVLGVCQRVLGHRQDVEDAFQATFLVLARDAHRVKKRDSLASWLHGVAYRTSLRAAESRHRRIRLLQDVTMIEDPSSLASVEARHERQLLDEELQSLPDKYRAPLVLYYLEGKTAQQVAGDLKLTVSTVEGRLKRGRKELQLRLARRGVGLSIALAALHLTPSLVTAAEVNTLVGSTIHAGLSYTAGDPAGPLFTHEAARLAAQETLAMTAATTTATLTAVLLVPLALTVANHGSPEVGNKPLAPIISTAQGDMSEGSGIELSEPQQVAQATADHESEIPPEFRSRRGESPEEQRIQQALNSDVAVEIVDATIEEALQKLASARSINIVLDPRDVGIDHSQRYDLIVSNIKLRSALRLLLEQAGLGYHVEDEVIKVTSWDAAPHYKSMTANARKIEKALHEQTQLEFVGTMMSEVFDFISQQHDIPILVDDASISFDYPVNLIISNVKLESGLKHMLRPYKLTYVIRDEVLLITTREVAESLLETRVYDLRKFSSKRQSGLDQVIMGSLPDAAWQKIDGIGGTIEMVENGMVVTQTQQAHRQIVELLEQLQRLSKAGEQGGAERSDTPLGR